jgi:hypothetical protein
MRVIEEKLYTKLSTDSTLANMVGGTINPRIYNTTAPPYAAYPLIVFHKQGGGETSDTPRDNVEITYVVKAIGGGLGACLDVDDRCRQLLDKQDLQVGSGYADYATFRKGHLNFAEEVSGGSVIYHVGAYYTIMAAGTA